MLIVVRRLLWLLACSYPLALAAAADPGVRLVVAPAALAPAGETPASGQASLEGVTFALTGTPAAPVWSSVGPQGLSHALKAPPAGLLPTLVALGPSHILGLTPDRDGAEVWAYHTITDTWTGLGHAALGGRLERAWTSGGALRVAARTPSGQLAAYSLAVVSVKPTLALGDYAVIVAYLAIVAGIGLYCYLRSAKDTATFFLGARQIPWWAAGLSLYATGTSSLSFLAIPAKAYATNWLYFAQNIVGLFGTLYVGIAIVPLIRKLNIVSVYQYLEMRFHPAVRLIASGICVAQHLIGRMSVVLLLPALALAAVTDLSVTTSIVLMGVVSTAYTALGGMKAVIWTDTLQVLVMMGGATVALACMVHGAGGWGAATALARSAGKTEVFDWGLTLSRPTVWVFLLVTLFQTLTWPQDQVMTQRVLAVKDAKAATKSVMTLCLVALPGSLLFFALGAGLYVFYAHHPGHLDPNLDTDQIFPHFIGQELPVGIKGLIIAGIFAASMATLSSNINSIATLISVDFYDRLLGGSQARGVKLAEYTTFAVGLLATGVALYLSRLHVTSLYDRFVEMMYVLGGGFAGIYGLGIFSRRANWQGALVGIAASIAVTVYAKYATTLHVLMYAPLSIGTCMGTGWVASLAFPPPGGSLRGLTLIEAPSAA